MRLPLREVDYRTRAFAEVSGEVCPQTLFRVEISPKTPLRGSYKPFGERFGDPSGTQKRHSETSNHSQKTIQSP